MAPGPTAAKQQPISLAPNIPCLDIFPLSRHAFLLTR